MAEDGRGRDGRRCLENEIGVSEADPDHANEDLIFARFVDLEFLDREIRLGRPGDRSLDLHPPPPLSRFDGLFLMAHLKI